MSFVVPTVGALVVVRVLTVLTHIVELILKFLYVSGVVKVIRIVLGHQ